jgi:hypothetical protein
VQAAAQVQRSESRQGDDSDAMRGTDMEGDRASIALQRQIGDDHGQVQPLSSSLRLAASIRSVVSAGGSTRRSTSSTVSPADGAVGAPEVLSQLLSDACGDIAGQTGGSDGA